MNSEHPKQAKDFRHPTRMGWEALIVSLFTSIWTFIKGGWFLLIPIFFGSFKSFSWYIFVFILIGVFIISITNTLIKYFTTKLHVAHGQVICTTGLFSQQEQSIPLNRIHALRTKEGFLYQMVDMVGIVFDTISTEQAELEFILNKEDWKALSALVDTEGRVITQETEMTEHPNAHYQLGLKGLLISALTQNHLKGLAVIGIILATIYNAIPDQEWFINEAINSAQGIVLGFTILSIIITLVVVYLTSVLLWIFKIILQYWGLRVEFYDQHLIYQAGLFNKVTIKVPRDKVIGIESKCNILEKRLGLKTITILQAKNVEGIKQGNRVVMYGISFGKDLTQWWLGQSMSEDKPNYVSCSGIILFWRSFAIQWLPVLAIYSLYAVIFLPRGLLLHIVLLPIAFWESWLKYKKSRVELYDNHFVVQHGRFADKQTILPYSSVEHLQAQRIHFANWHSKRKKLTINTKSDPSIIRSLPKSEATNIYDYILFRTSN